jgi:hypothetical protein
LTLSFTRHPECFYGQIRPMLEDFLSDLRYGLRQLLRSPGVAVVCVLTLTLGIGANAAIFSAVHAVLLRPLPFPNSDRLVLVNDYNPGNVAKTGSPRCWCEIEP